MNKNLPKLAFFFFFATTIVSFFGRIYVSSNLATGGSEVRSLESEIQDLGSENEQLEREIASLSSLVLISERAKALGMVKPLTLDFLTPLPSASVNLASSL